MHNTQKTSHAVPGVGKLFAAVAIVRHVPVHDVGPYYSVKEVHVCAVHVLVRPVTDQLFDVWDGAHHAAPHTACSTQHTLTSHWYQHVHTEHPKMKAQATYR
jgi:hypothetical protein